MPFIKSIEAAIIADIVAHIDEIEQSKRNALEELQAAHSNNDRKAMRYSKKEYRRIKREIELCNTKNSAPTQN